MHFILILVASVTVLNAQTLRFSLPIDGVVNENVIIVNHVDHDSSQGIKDFRCGVYTYDGHDGTDFVLKSFKQMDDGVAVLAAADGVVLEVVDSLFDRNKSSVKERGFGNYITIRHIDGYVSYYAHIRRASASIRVGERVERGQPIALVGSSGNSSDPHLHFEVWRRIDPFGGNCADAASHWVDPPPVFEAYKLHDHGVTTWPPRLDTLRERPPSVRIIDTTATSITYWSLQSGVRSTDVLGIVWKMPDGTSWFQYSSAAGITTNYYYWWSYIDYTKSSMPAGTWQVVAYVNGSEVARDTFEVPVITSVREDAHAPTPLFESNSSVVIRDLTGRLIWEGRGLESTLDSLADGTYTVSAFSNGYPSMQEQNVAVIVRDGIVFGMSKR